MKAPRTDCLDTIRFGFNAQRRVGPYHARAVVGSDNAVRPGDPTAVLSSLGIGAQIVVPLNRDPFILPSPLANQVSWAPPNEAPPRQSR
jgi:hypothetical protein